jgi:hypothetical protein
LLSPTSFDAVHDFAYHEDYLLVDDVAYSGFNSNDVVSYKVSEEFDMSDSAIVSIPPNLQRAREYPRILDWLTQYQLNPHSDKHK